MKLKAISYHLEEKFNLGDVQTKVDLPLIRKESSYLFYRLEDSSYIYIKDFGSIVFINCVEKIIADIIEKISSRKIIINELPKEKYDILIEENKPQNVAFDVVYLREINDNVAQVISFNLAQSVAIDHYNNDSIKLVAQITVYTNQLKKKGNVLLSFKEMRRFIGETMNIKNRIAKNLYIFETTHLAWSDEQLANLDNDLRLQLDVINRFHELQNNLNIVKENLDFFQAIIQHKHSSKLEWIIIILILFEVIQVIFKNI